MKYVTRMRVITGTVMSGATPAKWKFMVMISAMSWNVLNIFRPTPPLLELPEPVKKLFSLAT